MSQWSRVQSPLGVSSFFFDTTTKTNQKKRKKTKMSSEYEDNLQEATVTVSSKDEFKTLLEDSSIPLSRRIWNQYEVMKRLRIKAVVEGLFHTHDNLREEIDAAIDRLHKKAIIQCIIEQLEKEIQRREHRELFPSRIDVMLQDYKYLD